ncbi:MAG: GGDEF domain-containing protein [Candidatus Sericytochromatia bacterium]
MYKHLPVETRTKIFFKEIYYLLDKLKSEHDISIILQNILTHTSDYLDIRNSNIYMYSQDKMVSIASVNESNEIEIAIPKNEVEKLISNFFIIDEESLSFYPSLSELNLNYSRVQVLSPLTYDNNLLGLMTYGHKLKSNFEEDDKLIISLISTIISKIIFYSENYINISHKSADEVYLKTIIDSLSGLYIKSYIEQRMKEMIKESIRYKKADSFCLLKIELFNHLREKYTQSTVNEIINKTGIAIRNFIRVDVDLAGKYSEDTFLILLPSTQIKGAIIFSEKLKSFLKNIKPENIKDEDVFFSIGLTSIEPQDKNNETIFNKLLDALDFSLRKGGNRVSYHYKGELVENLSDFEKAKGMSTDLVKETITHNYTLLDENGNEIEFNTSFNKHWLNIPKQ